MATSLSSASALLASLVDRVDKATVDGVTKMPTQTFPDRSFGDFLDGLVLTDLKTTADDDKAPTKVSFTGSLRDGWALPTNSAVKLVGARLELAVDLTKESATLRLTDGTLSLPGGRAAAAGVTVESTGAVSLTLDRIDLGDLLRAVAGEADFALPKGFPDIVLTSPNLAFPRDSADDHELLVKSRVNAAGWTVDVGVLILQRAKKSSATRSGYAVLLSSSTWSTGWVPSNRWQTLAQLSVQHATLLIASEIPAGRQWDQLAPADTNMTHPIAVLAEHAGDLHAGYAFGAFLELTQAPRLKPVCEALELAMLELFVEEGADGTVRATVSTAMLRSPDVVSWRSFALTYSSSASESTMQLTAAGSIALNKDAPLTVEAAGSLSFDGFGSLTLKIADWVAPFGAERLTVRALKAEVTVTKTGVSIGLGGSFEFTTAAGNHVTFAVIGMLRGLTAPGALACTLRSASAKKTLTVGEIVTAVTTIDLSVPDSPASKSIRQLDGVLSISGVTLWASSADAPLTIGGERYAPGFGFLGDITVLGHSVCLFVEINGLEKRFSGYAELPDVVSFGSVLTLARPAAPTLSPQGTLAARQLDPGKGPVVSVSSQIDAAHADYLMVAVSVALFDLVRTDVFVRLNPAGLTFSVGVAARAHSDDAHSAAWLDQQATVTVPADGRSSQAHFSCDFGLRNVALGGFKVFGVTAPIIEVPDFAVRATLDVSVDLAHKALILEGVLGFSCLGLVFDDVKLTGGKPLRVTLESAPGNVAGLGEHVVSWIRANLSDLVRNELKDAKDFTTWAAQHTQATAEQVAHALLNNFRLATRDAAALLKSGYEAGSATALLALHAAGCNPEDAAAAITTAYGWSLSISAAASQAFGGVATHLKQFVKAEKVDLVLFNLSAHAVRSDGKYGDDISETPKPVTVIPGETAVVGQFNASSGNWGYLFLKDVENNTRFQLYIQMASIIATPYHSLQYVNQKPKGGNHNPNPLPAGSAHTAWTGTGPAAYRLDSLPIEQPKKN